MYSEHTQIYLDHQSLPYIFTQRDLNLRQRHWLELIKDYDIELLYHPGKANVVADALSRKTMSSLQLFTADLRRELDLMGVDLTCYGSSAAYLDEIRIRPTLVDRIREAQAQDTYLIEHRDRIASGGHGSFYLHEDGTVRYAGTTRLYVPHTSPLVREIMDEAHSPCNLYILVRPRCTVISGACSGGGTCEGQCQICSRVPYLSACER